jgi:hypothetical protein
MSDYNYELLTLSGKDINITRFTNKKKIDISIATLGFEFCDVYNITSLQNSFGYNGSCIELYN